MKDYFFSYLYRMRYIQRWGLMKNSAAENLAEHTLDTAVIAHALAVIGNRIFGKNHSPERCAAAALFHDAPEILTGDLPTPVKYFNPEIREAYKKVEKNAAQKLLGYLPEELYPEYHSLFEAVKGDGDVANVVHWADKLSAYIKCMEEMKSGNHEFKTASESIRKGLEETNSEEVAYFLEHFIPGFALTLDELD